MHVALSNQSILCLHRPLRWTLRELEEEPQVPMADVFWKVVSELNEVEAVYFAVYMESMAAHESLVSFPSHLGQPVLPHADELIFARELNGAAILRRCRC